MINSRLKKIMAMALIWAIALDSPAVVLAKGTAAGELRSSGDVTLQGSMSGYELYKAKKELAKGIRGFEKLTPGTDYIEHSFAIEADTREDAERIAASYGGELTVYDMGVGSMTVSSNFSTEEILEIAADTSNLMPVVYPELIYTPDEIDDDSLNYQTGAAEAMAQALPENAPNDYEGQSADRYWQHIFTESFDAWGVTKGKDVTVAVIDSGIDVDHEDLQGGNVRYDLGYNAVSARFVSESGVEVINDVSGHGTHVAGIIGAEADNEIGIAGIAPEAELVPIRIFSKESGSGSTSAMVRAVNYAASLKVDVVNMSFGGPADDVLYSRAFKAANKIGVTFVASAGNSGQDNPNYPGTCPETIAVAALQSQAEGKEGVLAYYSNYGSYVNIAAPGTNIYSTDSLHGTKGTAYSLRSGTSMATPVVTGIVALIKSANPKLRADNKASVKKTKKILLSSARNESYYCNAWVEGKGSADSPWIWRGVNAVRAVSKAASVIPGLKLKRAQLSDTADLILEPENSGAKVMYSIGSRKNLTEYEGPVSVRDIMAEKGRVTVYTRVVFGLKKSSIKKQVFTAGDEAVSVVFNGTGVIHVAPGGRVKLVPTVSPNSAKLPALTWSSSDRSFYIKGSYLYCRKDTAKGTAAILEAYSGDRKISEITAYAAGTERLYVSPAILEHGTLAMSASQSIEKYASPCDYEIEAISANGIYGRIDLDKYIVCDGSGVKIRSSRPSVVYVEDNRYLVAKREGKAKITLTATDGSGRKFSFMAKSVMPVYKINAIRTSTGFVACDIFSGNKSKNDVINTSYKCETNQAGGGKPIYDVPTIPIAVGGQIALKAYLNDDYRWKSKKGKGSSKPKNSEIIWTSADPELLSVAHVGKNIVVTTASENRFLKKNKYGDFEFESRTVSVTAKAADGFGAERTIDFKIYAAPGMYSFSPEIEGEILLPDIGDIIEEQKLVNDYIDYSGEYSGIYKNFKVSFDHDRLMRAPVQTDSSGNIISFGAAGQKMFYYRRNRGNGILTYRTMDGTGQSFSYVFID